IRGRIASEFAPESSSRAIGTRFFLASHSAILILDHNMESGMEREPYYDDKTYWDVWQAVHWLDDKGRPLENDEVADRFNTRYLVRNPKRGTEIPHDYTVAERGLQNLSIHDAVTLGFTTSEYQTAIRYLLLECREITSEEELAELAGAQRTQMWNYR
ncbi:hypothetical protein, partial [Rhizobium sp. M1]|uniref:hypothetical protein n=1 Tax=Rhizobium sp. M1 TaxID=2035453 RepID=UPI000BEDA3FD